MADDADKPQTKRPGLTSEEVEALGAIARAQEARRSDGLDILAASASAGHAAYEAEQAKRRSAKISRAPPPAPRLEPNSGSGGLFQSRIDHEREDRADLRAKLESAFEQQQERAAQPIQRPKPPSQPEPQEAAKPMHPRDRRFYVILAWTAIPAALVAGCFLAWGSKQLSGLWASIGIVMGLAGMAIATFYALEKKAPAARYPGPVILGIALVTWLLIGWQTWLTFYAPARQHAQVVSGSPFGPTVYTEGGPIGWNLDSQFLVAVAIADGVDAIDSVVLQGKSRTSTGFREAYAISGLTGHRQTLYASVPNKGGFQVTKVDVPPNADVQLTLNWSPPLAVRDFLDQWGNFRVVITYDDGSVWDHEFGETYIKERLNRLLPSALGPRVTLKEGK